MVKNDWLATSFHKENGV